MGKRSKEYDFVQDWGENVIDQVVEDTIDDMADAPVQEAAKKPGLYRIQSKSALSTLPVEEEKPSQKDRKKRRHRPKGSSRRKREAGQVCDKCSSSHDMPALHYAAYKGHYQCLDKLLERQHFEVYDKQQRTPLFYACAANRVDCCTLLLLKCVEWIDQADDQLDTVAHVCCFFGWNECLERVLQAGANPHARNAKGFLPSHIAKNKECLELLLSYGDDLLQGDQLGRTPLFVACARNREACVEFLCAWNYQTSAWMLEQRDERGDEPIHAAACNGCTGCVRILLQYGATGTTQNANGLTALQLAQAANHTETAEMLSYSSEPDSVDTTQVYDEEAESEWTECIDPSTHEVFYYSKATGRCQWEKPSELANVTTAEVWTNDNDETFTEQHTQDIYNNAVQEAEEEYVWVKKKRETVQVMAGTSQWRAVQDPYTKAIYYKNEATGDTQWEEPAALARIQREATAHASHHASELWDELNKSREMLATALEEERRRQLEASMQRLKNAKAIVAQRKSTLKQSTSSMKALVANSSFRRQNSRQKIISGGNGDIDRLCDEDPTLEIFLTTYLQSQGSTCTQGTTKIITSLFHYYASLADPANPQFLSKSQFRGVLKASGILPARPTDKKAPLKLHVADLVYVEANRTVSDLSIPENSTHKTTDAQMDSTRFLVAMKMIGERVVTILEANGEIDEDIADDDMDSWLVENYLLSHLRDLAAQLGEIVGFCQEQDERISTCSIVQSILDRNRKEFQAVYSFYSGIDSNFKLLKFADMVHFATDFSIIPSVCNAIQLHQVVEAVNWISGNTHTQVISYAKFIQILALLPLLFPEYDSSHPSHEESPDIILIRFMQWMDKTDGKHIMSKSSTKFAKLFNTSLSDEAQETAEIVPEKQVEPKIEAPKSQKQESPKIKEPPQVVPEPSEKPKSQPKRLSPLKRVSHRKHQVLPVDSQ